MRKWPPLLVIGLTGGIASGKTTVSRLCAGLGATVLNADDVGREVVVPGEPALGELIAAFGPEYLRADGTLDRRALGDRVFGSPRDLAVLNRITHPRIDAALQRRLRALAADPPDPPIVVVEAAVLLEAGWDPLVDKILVVATQPSTQLSRLSTVAGLSPSQAQARIRAQLPLAARLRHADYRVSGEPPLARTQQEVAALWREWLQAA